MEKIILGIDPGSNIMGYGVVGCIGKNYRLLDMDVLVMNKIKDPLEKLRIIFEGTCRLVEKYQVHETAIEEPFYGKNVQSMLKLGRAQGMAIAASIHCGLPVHLYAPRRIKQSITGNGNASKEQVSGMLRHLLSFKEDPKYLDATDGLAVAICHAFQNNAAVAGASKYNSWQSFITNNPGRISG